MFDRISVLIQRRDVPCLRIECPEGIGIKGYEVVAEPTALGEAVPEFFLFSLIEASQVKLQLHANRAHRGVTEAGFLAVFLDRIILLDAC